MANDEKLILHEKERMDFLFVPTGTGAMFPVPFKVPAHDLVVKKPKGIFNINMLVGALVGGAIALALMPAVTTIAAIGIVTASAAAVGLLAGTTSEIVRTKRYNRALKQQEERLEKENGISPSEAVAQEAKMESENGKKFQETEKSRRNFLGLLPATGRI